MQRKIIYILLTWLIVILMTGIGINAILTDGNRVLKDIGYNELISANGYQIICQIKFNTYDELPSNSSLGVLYFIHLRGLLFIKFRLFFSSSGSTSDRSIPLG